MDFAFERLEVWQIAMRLVREVYLVTAAFPRTETFGLTSQLRRAAVSIPVNIAEGEGRYHKKEFVQFLYNARGSLYETMTLLQAGADLQYLKTTDHQRLIRLTQQIGSKLSGLINSLKQTPALL